MGGNQRAHVLERLVVGEACGVARADKAHGDQTQVNDEQVQPAKTGFVAVVLRIVVRIIRVGVNGQCGFQGRREGLQAGEEILGQLGVSIRLRFKSQGGTHFATSPSQNRYRNIGCDTLRHGGFGHSPPAATGVIVK